MSVTAGIVSFAIIWWMVFFMALPFGVKPPEEVEEGMEPGQTKVLTVYVIDTGVQGAGRGLTFCFCLDRMEIKSVRKNWALCFLMRIKMETMICTW